MDRPLLIMNYVVLFGKLIAALALSLTVVVNVCAQKPKHVRAEYTYISENKEESPSQSEKTAFFRARCKALENEFGAMTGSQTDIVTMNDNGNTSVRFRQHGGTEIKADWLKTIKEEVRKRAWTDDGFMVIEVYVEGMAREIVSASVDFEYHLLRNGDKLENEDDRFRNNDRMALSFKAPVDGYLAVYITDDSRAYCMLPYKEQTDGIYRIKANKEYIFFHENHAQLTERGYDLRMRLVTDKQQEDNTVYIIFSQKPFTKKTDSEGSVVRDNLVLVRNVAIEEFEDWLYKCQRQDEQLRVEKKPILITKK